MVVGIAKKIISKPVHSYFLVTLDKGRSFSGPFVFGNPNFKSGLYRYLYL